MPRRDGTGPMGSGSMTGRGLEFCTVANAVKCETGVRTGLDRGLACRGRFGRGFGKGLIVNHASSKTQKELLNEQKTMLQDQLEVIDKQLENL